MSAGASEISSTRSGELQLKSVRSYSRAQGPNSGSVEKQQIIFTPEPARQLRAVNFNILRVAVCVYIYITS